MLATYYLDDDDDDDNDDDETPDEQANGTEAGGGIMVIHRLQEEGTVEEVERALVSPITIRAKSQSKSRRTSRSHSRSHSSSIESQSEGQSLRDQRMKMHTPIGVSPLAEEFPRQIVMLGRSDSDSASRSRSSSLGLKADLLGALDVGVGLDMGEDFGKGFFFG